MILRGSRVVLPEGMRPATIRVRDGRIDAVDEGAPASDERDVLEAGDLVVLPGVVDTHVHINDPGRSDWEGFETATRAAAAGGVTTLVDMPLNSVPSTITPSALEAKRTAAHGRCHVDVGFWGGVVPGNAGSLEALAAAGVRGFKCFLAPSGVDDFPHVGEADLGEALPIVARLDLPLLAHAEWPAALREPRGDPRRYGTWLDSRPAEAEVAAVNVLTRLAEQHDARLHIVHLGTTAALPSIEAARTAGVRVTVETCPHYLTFAAERIEDGRTSLKCAPPIRTQTEQDGLWDALVADRIDLIASDHSPAPPALKHLDDGDFVAAWGGIASLQLGLSIVWTRARGSVRPERLARWMSEAPARLAGLYPVKGVIAPGADADFVLWDPDTEWIVDARSLYHRHAVTPYHDLRLRGRVRTTILRGSVIFDDGACCGAATGRLL